MKKLLLPLLLLLLLLTSCGKTKRKYVVGVSQCSVDIWREKFNEELKTGALISDSLVIRLESANDDDRRQSEQIRQMVDDGVDLLIVSPNQLRTISSAIDRAHEKGIPVILYDRKISSNNYTAFIGCDNYQIGKAMAQHIAARLDGHGRVVEIAGLEGSSPAIERHRGFTDALRDYPDLHLVASEAGDWKEESGSKAMEAILRQTQDFDFVFCHNDRMAVGARKAAMRRGMNGYRYTGVDGLATKDGGLMLVRDGALDASYLYPTKGNEVIALAMKILTGKPYERENYLQASIVTADNAELSLMEAHDAEQQRENLGALHRQVDGYIAQYKSQKIITIGLIGFLALLAFFIVVVYRSLIMKARLNEKIVELTQSRLVFFTNISHELRTPLTLIADPVELLLADGSIKERQRDLLTMVQRNARSLQQLVDAILDFRKVENDKMSLSVSPFDIVEAMKMWTSDFRLSAQSKQIELTLDTSRYTANAIIQADAEKVARIVFNLLSNALKHTPQQGSITVALQSASPTKLRIDVRDTGSGMDKADADRIFERFFQAKNTTGGTGIGLALVKAYAELHHGTVGVESERGKGSDFWVELPIVAAEQAPQKQAAATDAAPDKPAGQGQPAPETHADGTATGKQEGAPAPPAQPADAPRLLIIDDNADIRHYLHTLLDGQYTVLEATDGQEGLAVAEREVPDLVVCDVMMPVMDGLAFCRHLKTTTSTSHIPVIMLTAKAMDEHRVEGYEQGADSYIAKPFQSRVLLARIRNLLQQRSLLRQCFAPKSRTEEAPQPTLAPREAAFMQQVDSIIAAHLTDSDFNVEAIGQEIGLSRVQLYRKVKALTGTSVVDLLRRSRLSRARTLLATTARSVSEVAYDTGFSSPSYFAKCFKDEYGLTPGEFATQQ